MADAHENGRRSPPAFQEYAAAMLADRGFRSMAAIERGLLYSMRLECWTNGSVPANPAALARVLGLEAAEVKQGLTLRVLRHFEAVDGPESTFVCPALDNYRRQLEDRHSRMSEGGRQGARLTNTVRRGMGSGHGHPDAHPDTQLCAHPDGHPGGNGRGHPDGPLSTDQTSTNQNSVYRQTDEHAAFKEGMSGAAPFEEQAARRGKGVAVSR
jgi:hypothetical protein